MMKVMNKKGLNNIVRVTEKKKKEYGTTNDIIYGRVFVD